MAGDSAYKTAMIDGWEHELDVEFPFIGREHDLKLLKEALIKGHRLFGVFGIRAVGKSRLVKTFLMRCAFKCTRKCSTITGSDVNAEQRIPEKNRTNELPIIIRLDLGQQTHTSAVYANLCASIGETPGENNTNDKRWILQIARHVKRQSSKQFILFLDNVDNAEEGSQLSEDIKSLCLELVLECVNIMVFITSTTKFMSARLNRVYFCHELKPLLPTESAELLRVIAPEADLGEYKDVIVKLSEGLPLLLSMIANELADDQWLITPKYMAELLATSRLKCLSRRDFYAEEDRIADVYKKFIDRLKDIYRHRLAVLGYIPGSFDVREAKEILGLESEAQTKDETLIPIRRHFMLNYDSDTGRFNIQGLLRECLDVFYIIKNITDVRKRYCQLFSTIMVEISSKLRTEESVKALAQFSMEQPNFQKLMKEVYYSTEDNYRFFITMATNCTDLMERFLLKECDNFYDCCLVMAGQYGNDEDTAMVNIAFGSMWTNAKDDLKRGEEHYQQALKVLTPRGNSLELATIYQRLGWNLHKQGFNIEAVKLFQKSLNISQCGGPAFRRLWHQSMNSIGVAHTIIGNYADAEKYHFSSLRYTKTTMKNDAPQLGFIYNNIGTLYSAKEDKENALKYYIAGLENKKKNQSLQSSIVISCCNVASAYCKLQQYDKAHELVGESLEVIMKQEIPSREILALIYDTKGKVLFAEERYKEALDAFEQSADIRERLASHSHVESLVHIVISRQRLGKYKACISKANEVIVLQDKVEKTSPGNTYIVECYECLAEAYIKLGSQGKYLDTLENLAAELDRLEDFHMQACNEGKLVSVRKQILDVRDKIEEFRQNKPYSPFPHKLFFLD